ncbi:hypothetical protein [Celeribacter persicus]|uniref:Galactose mutarotase-like enzyme n=1 Tax=Celeribacter persicus TaxID=1651082 RepID=A0A2T5HK08_9RHOB|nr:hypothetical protein [Celeribacter persicus]PTQ71904.1 hypothetical protein C8N42_10783 [Celeribacter persicus]
MERWLRLRAGPLDLAFDPEVGNIRRFAVRDREIFHTAHWVGTPAAEAAGSVIDAHLAGDFLAAPFGSSDLLDDPPHGWSANARWHPVVRAEGGACAVMKLALERPVMGARITKELRFCEAHPVLYQRHVISGGQGGLTFAHHPMFRVSPGDHIAFSPKRAAVSNDPLEPAHRLAAWGRSADLSAFPAADGGTVDLTRYPDRGDGDTGHEDFVTLVEADIGGIGWTAVSRLAESDIVVVLKDSRVMPVTMLWISNGGRGYAPWDGRHDGVLGIEDGCAAGAEGHRAALGDNAVAREGVATAFALTAGGSLTLRHAIAVLERPPGWAGVVGLSVGPDRLTVHGIGGGSLAVPFDGTYFSV